MSYSGILGNNPPKNHPNPNVAIIYGRVSTTPQAYDGTSMHSQFEYGVGFAANNGLIIPDEGFISDEGVSGKRYWTRPGIQRALELIEQKRGRWLICEAVDRSARRAKIGIKIAERVWDAGGILVCNGMIMRGDEPNLKLVAQFFFGLAEWDYETTIGKLNKGRRTQALGHNPSHPYIQAMQRGTPAYGLYIPTALDVAKELFPPLLEGRHVIIKGDEKQARALNLIHEMYEMHDAGVSLSYISNWLFLKGIRTPRGKAKWSTKTLDYLFRNEVYSGAGVIFKTTGLFDERRELELGIDANYRVQTPQEERVTLLPVIVYDPISKTWEDALPIVELDLWEAVRLHRDEENKKHKHLGRLKFYLSHFGICPVCGNGWAGAEIKSEYGVNKYLRCSGCSVEGRKQKICPSRAFRYIRWERAEKVFLAGLERIVTHPQAVEEVIDATERRIYSNDSYSLRRDQLLHEQKETRKRLDVTTELQIDAKLGDLDTTPYDKKIVALNADLKRINRELEDVLKYTKDKPRESSRTRSQKLASVLKDIVVALRAEEISPDRKALALKGIIDFVTVNQDGRMVIRFKNLSHIPDLGVEIIGDNVYEADKRRRPIEEKESATTAERRNARKREKRAAEKAAKNAIEGNSQTNEVQEEVNGTFQARVVVSGENMT
jgi:hypothetical protein